MILATIALGVAALGGWAMAVAIAAMVSIVAYEWARMTIADTTMAAAVVAAPAVAAVLIAQAGSPVAALAVGFIGAGAAGILLRSGWAIAGAIYAGALGVALILLRADAVLGLEALVFVLLVVWGSDTGAYLVGRTVGGPKLWPRVSPKKTWSGFVGGTAIGVAAGVAAALIAGIPVTLGLAVVALALSLLSAAGDLFESAVKRRFNTKDSGSLIPGHGGLMDRVDGLVFAATGAALIGWLHAGGPDFARALLTW